MTGVTREMIGAGHGATLKHGIVLSHEVLTEIYLSMDGLANHAKTSGSPQDAALLRQALEALKNSREYIVAEYEQRKALYEGYPHMAYKYRAEANDLASIDALITALKERLGEKT